MNLNYKILVTCRDLLYPAGENIFTYMVWANPINDEDPARLGELGFGRAEFVIKRAFDELFVTTERDKRAKTPEGPIVMRGTVEKIQFLDEPAKAETQEDKDGEETPSVDEITPSPTPSARQRLITGLRRAALVSILALVSLVGLIFVLTRKK